MKDKDFDELIKGLENEAEFIGKLLKGEATSRDKAEALFLIAYESGLIGSGILELFYRTPTDINDLTGKEFLYVTIGYGLGQKALNEYGDLIIDSNTTTH